MKFALILCLVTIVLSETITCASNQSKISVIRTYKSGSAEEVFEIWEGASNTGIRKASESGVSKENSVVTYEYCLSPAVHTFVATDGDNNGWSDGSFFVIKNAEEIVILQGTLDRYTRQEWMFDATLSIGSTSNWKYSYSAQSDSWKTPSFSDNTWSSSKSGSFPTPTGLTRYFRNTVNVPSSYSNYALYEVGAYTREGVIIYVNGEEVYRRNMPTTSTATTPASSTDSDLAYRRTTGPLTTSTMTSSTVVIAIEIHGTTIPTSETFKGFFVFFYGPCNKRTQDGTVASNHGDNGNSKETMASAFDDDIQTIWYFNNIPAHLDYTFNSGRTEWINAYEITVGYQWDQRMPKTWKVYGSNGNDNWQLLDYKSDYQWPNRRYTKRFYLNTNTQRYNAYRFEILTVVENSDGELSEFELLACNTPIETPSLKYPETNYSLLRDLNEIRIMPTQNGFGSFTINPSLPNGLSLNSNTGTISGKPTVVTSATSYTITATHYSSSSAQSTILTITSYDCAAPMLRIDLYKVTAKNGYDGYEYSSIKNAQGTLIWEYEIIASDYSDSNDKKFYLCVNPGIYTVTGSAHSANGWAETSFLAIDSYGRGSGYCISRFTLYKKQTDSYQLNISYESESSFKAMLTVNSIPANWNTASFDDSTWTTYSASQNLQATTAVWLFRQKFTVSTQTLGQGFEYRILVRAGTIVYLDGVNINKILVPEGELTSSTRATGGIDSGSSSPEWRVITGLMSMVQPGTHVFATAVVHKNDYSSRVCDFDGSLLIITDSNNNPRNVDMYGNASSQRWDGADAGKMADQSYSTRFASWLDGDTYINQWGQLNYNKWRTELVNKYCIVNGWDAPQSDPKKWTLKGSNDDGNTLTDIDTQENVIFDSRSEKLCFYVPQNTNTYRSFRIEVSETKTPFPTCRSVIISELEFYIMDYSKLNIAALAYPQSSIVSYVNADFPTTKPSSDYYHGFTISPALPTGLYMMSGTGRIYGTPTVASSASYTITAINPQGTTSSATILITISNCVLPKSLIKISITGVEIDGIQNSYTLTTLSGQTIASLNPFPRWADSIENSYCLDPQDYIFTINDSGNNGWEKGRLVVTNENGEQLIKTSLQYGESPKIFNLNLGYLVSPSSGTFKYKSITSAPETNWNTASYNDNSWSQATVGSVSGLSGVTTLYRVKFDITDLSTYVVYELMTKIHDGAIVYLNGKEINRIHLPSVVNDQTKATEQFITPTKVISSGSIQFGDLIQGTNILAVEIHRYSDTPETTFDYSIKLERSGSYRIVDGSINTNAEGFKNSSYDETAQYAFDGSVASKYFTNKCMDGSDMVYIGWKYNNNRRDYVNSVTFYRNTDNNRIISYMDVRGSNDGTTWDILVKRDNIVFGDYNTPTSRITLDYYLPKIYNMYRVYLFNPSCSAGYEVGEIVFNAKRLDNFCAAQDGFTPAASGQIAEKSCANWYNGTIYRTCTNAQWETPIEKCSLSKPLTLLYDATTYIWVTNKINYIAAPIIRAAEATLTLLTSLPTGITFDSTTGAISGTPTVDLNNTKITIRTENKVGFTDTDIFISSLPATGLTGGMIALIVIAAIVLIVAIAIIIFCVVVRTKKTKTSHKKLEKKSSKGSSTSETSKKTVKV